MSYNSILASYRAYYFFPALQSCLELFPNPVLLSTQRVPSVNNNRVKLGWLECLKKAIIVTVNLYLHFHLY